jgi:cyclopropane fatty-acyl-phospholipid synthase-like methyltransferase
VEIIVADISTFEKDASYDRIHCIGMFEVGEFHATFGM